MVRINGREVSIHGIVNDFDLIYGWVFSYTGTKVNGYHVSLNGFAVGFVHESDGYVHGNYYRCGTSEPIGLGYCTLATSSARYRMADDIVSQWKIHEQP